MFIFHFFSKILSKSPCVRVSHFFVFSIFVKKVDSYILQKLSTLREIIMLSIGKNSLFFSFFNSFSPQLTSRNFTFFNHFSHSPDPDPPPPQCCWENVKKCQNFTYWYFDKNSKNTIINRETVFRKTTLSMGKSPKICRSFKG